MADREPVRLKPLDAFLPSYEFVERHGVDVRAEASVAERALREVTFGDLPAVRLLLRLRGIRAARPEYRVLEAMARRGTVLDQVPGEGVVLGIEGRFWRLRGGGSEPAATAVVDFRAADGSLTTETRVHVPEGESRRRFARYWLVVRPFSGITRKQLLRAAKRRAERTAA